MDLKIEYNAHLLEVRQAYWPGYRVKYYYGFIDGCRVPLKGFGWIGGFDPQKVEAELKRTVTGMSAA